MAQETVKAAGQVLTEPQTKRLEQIRFQMSGTGVFTATPFTTTAFTSTGGTSTSFRAIATNPFTKLTLTPSQVVKIDAVLADAAKSRNSGRREFGGFGGFIAGRGPDRLEAPRRAQRKKPGWQVNEIGEGWPTFRPRSTSARRRGPG